jgi:hypothetical protein
VLRAVCQLSIEILQSAGLGLRAGNGLTNALNEIATKPSPAADVFLL